MVEWPVDGPHGKEADLREPELGHKEQVQFFSFFFFLLFRATLTAYESSQARSHIRATAADLHRSPSNATELYLHSSPQRKARDRTCVLMDPSRVG